MDKLKSPWIPTAGLFLIMSSFPVFANVALEGNVAPNFTLKASDGFNQRLSEYRGQVVLLNFWASWCGPCRQEIPHLEKLYRSYEKLGFVVLGVNLDEKNARAQQMLAELGASFPTVFDNEKQVSKLYRINAMPTTVLIDRDGKVRHIHRGYQASYIDQYQKEIRKLLRE